MRYQTLLTQLNTPLIKNIEVDYLLPMEETRCAGQPLSPFQYDVITGISGVLNYVLEYVHIEAMQALAQRMVRVLVLLKEYDPSLLFGYKCFASLPKGYETILIDDAGFLDGVIGALLSLLFLTSQKTHNWIKLCVIN